MSPELEEECFRIINRFCYEPNKDKFFVCPSVFFITDNSKLNIEYFSKCLKNIHGHSKGLVADPNSFYSFISQDFVEYFHEHLDWKWISSSTKLSESFIEKYKDKLCWQNMMHRQKFTEEFLNKHLDMMGDYQNWVNLLYNPWFKTSKEFLLTHKDKIRKDLWEHDIVQKLL